MCRITGARSSPLLGLCSKWKEEKKVVNKLSGEGAGSAEWFTSIGNEHCQIVSFVLNCDESAEKLQPMCCGVTIQVSAGQSACPQDLVCGQWGLPCTGPNSCGDNGMFVHLDIFHWIHRFDAAIRTGSHSKYATFKSALAGAVLAYNRTHLELLIRAVRAKDLSVLKAVR
ncbi:hypothetical protein SRHO_G00025570 [Serrasalmus rhombeus]